MFRNAIPGQSFIGSLDRRHCYRTTLFESLTESTVRISYSPSSTCDDRAARQDAPFTGHSSQRASGPMFIAYFNISPRFLSHICIAMGRSRTWTSRAKYGSFKQRGLASASCYSKLSAQNTCGSASSACCFSRGVSPVAPTAASTECLRRPMPSIHATKHGAV